MEIKEQRITCLVDFAKNPQTKGVWSLRVDLDEQSLNSLAKLLNINDKRYYSTRRPVLSFRAASSSFERNAEMPAVIVPRLFAYLRGCLPKPDREQLPDLVPSPEESRIRKSSRFLSSRRYFYLPELASPPSRIGPSKKKRLSKATGLYTDMFSGFTLHSVPDIAPKLDCVSRATANYFQVSEEPEGVIKIFSPAEDTVLSVKSLFENIPGIKARTEVIKIFSPENILMEMYLPILGLTPPKYIVKDKSVLKNILLALEDAREERYTHSVRAAGIGAEEVMVEIFESYIHEKVPEAPLGNIITELHSRINTIVYGNKKKSEMNLSDLKKSLGKLIEVEKSKKNSSTPLLSFLIDMQRTLIPSVESHQNSITELIDQNPRPQRVALFPAYVFRCLSELVSLRNRVSHRVEKGTSIANVGYIESAVAIRSLIVLANWWQEERSNIDYKLNRKTIIGQTIERSKAQPDDAGI